MDTQSSSSAPTPRLRVSRSSSIPQAEKSGDGTPQAGPSRLFDHQDDTDSDDGAHSTPKLPVKSVATEDHDSASLNSAETPAARLRALLARVPNESTSKSTPAKRLSTSSDLLDSDFEAPNFGGASSIAMSAAKDIFARARRVPGDSPQKTRGHRRGRSNSVDVSEIEGSPYVQRERAKNKGHRKSLSDEEVDKASKADQRSEVSARSSQAVTYDRLREGVNNSLGRRRPSPPRDNSETDNADASHDAFSGFNSDAFSPPKATSTPQRSLQMPSQFEFQSNLLEQDSGMAKALEDFESFEGHTNDSPRPVSFPPVRRSATPSSIPTRTHSLGHSRSHSNLSDKARTTRHGSAPVPAERPRTPVPPEHPRSHSRADSISSVRSEEDRRREREWNKPHPKTPSLSDHRHHAHSNGSRPGTVSPHPGKHGSLARHSSGASLSDMSSRGGSSSSNAEYRERVRETEAERMQEREREWNKPAPHSRPTSSLGTHSPHLHTRTRTQSHPTRPGSPASLLTPAHAATYHGHRVRTPSISSRPSSPNGSITSDRSWREEEDEVIHEIEHERERNWNAPHPKWHGHPAHAQSNSPLPSPSPSPSPALSRVKSPMPPSTPGRMPAHSTMRADSEKSLQKPAMSTLHARGKMPARSPSPQPQTRPSMRNGKHSASYFPRQPAEAKSPRAPSPEHEPDQPQYNGKQRLNGGAPGSGSDARFGWSFPRKTADLPPLELDKASPERPAYTHHARTPSSSSPTPGSRPSSRASATFPRSHIPVRTPDKADASEAARKRGHRRSLTELTEAVGRVPPRINVESVDNDIPEGPPILDADSVFASDEESPKKTGTPGRVSFAIPASEDDGPREGGRSRRPGTPPLLATSDEARLQRTLGGNALRRSRSPPTTPPSDSAPGPEHASTLSTPPRRSPGSSSKMEYHTPSPPKGLPELPDPPPEDDTTDHGPFVNRLRAANGDASLAKTPKPPGAWNATPGPSGVNGFARDLGKLSESESEEIPNGALPELSTTKTPKPPGAWLPTPAEKPREHLVRSQSVPYDPEESRVEHGLSTPVASLSRSSSLPPETPHPPGGWGSPPGIATRKSILKVRFDPERMDALNGNAGTTSEPQPSQENGSPELPITPISGPPSPEINRRPRSPGIRVVDAYGQETQDVAPVKKERRSSSVDTPRNRSAVRIVDAMGRAIEDTSEKNDIKTEDSSPTMTHNEALARVRQTLAELNEGMNELDQPSDDLDRDYERLHELDQVSHVARDTRNKLAQALRMAEVGEYDLCSKLGPLRASMRKNKFLAAFSQSSFGSWPVTSWQFWAIVASQLLLILLFYRYSLARADTLFLTKYYDPFNGDLYLYTSPPDTIRRSMSSYTLSSVWSTPSTLYREGWRAFVVEVSDHFWLMIYDAKRWTWETLAGPDTARANYSWPPT